MTGTGGASGFSTRAPGGPLPERWRWHLVAALAVALLVTAGQVAGEDARYPYADARVYLSIAADLERTGVFGDGVWGHSTGAGPVTPGMFFAPLYPGFVAAVLALDDTFADSARCLVVVPPADLAERCAANLGLLIPVQTGLAALAAVLVFASALVVCRSLAAAWLALGLGLATGVYAHYATQVLTENLALPAFAAFGLALVVARGSDRVLPWLIAGAALGLATLVRPGYAWLLYVTVPFAALALHYGRQLPWREVALLTAVFAAGYAVVVAPWLIRNAAVLGSFALTEGYATLILSMRIGYNDMTAREWLAAFVYWLPDFGDDLGRALFGSETVARLGFDGPDSLRLASSTLRAQAAAAADTPSGQAGYLIRTHILGDLPWHLAVSFALAWRGLWIVKYWGLIGVLVSAPVAVIAARRRLWDFIVLAMPPVFMLGLHAFVSENVPRYNLILIPTLATAMAWAGHRLLRSALKRRARTNTWR